MLTASALRSYRLSTRSNTLHQARTLKASSALTASVPSSCRTLHLSSTSAPSQLHLSSTVPRALSFTARSSSQRTMSASATAVLGTGPMPNWTWQQSMIRIKDPEKSLVFYRDVMGLTLVDKYDFPQWSFTLYFMQSIPKGQEYTLEPGSDAAHKYVWSTNGVTIELTHNWGTETKEGPAYHPGNQEKDGFGHLAFACEDVYKCSEELEAAGVPFKKRPDEGRMKGLAFVYDPDGYWIEIVERTPKADAPKYTFAQTMLRVKDPKKSVPFYTAHLGMTLVRESHFADFSLYFLATLPQGTDVPDPAGDEAKPFVRGLYAECVPVLELTHNHGLENDADFVHNNGNVEPTRGFGHIGFLVDDVYKASDALMAAGVDFQKKPDEGGIKGLAFAKDPDGYWIEIVKRGQDGKF